MTGVPGAVGVARPAQVREQGVAVAWQGALAPLQAHQGAALVGERLQHPGPGRQFALLVGVVEEAKRSSPGPQDGRRRTRPFVDQGAYGSPTFVGRHLAQIETGCEQPGRELPAVPGKYRPVRAKYRLARRQERSPPGL